MKIFSISIFGRTFPFIISLFLVLSSCSRHTAPESLPASSPKKRVRVSFPVASGDKKRVGKKPVFILVDQGEGRGIKKIKREQKKRSFSYEQVYQGPPETVEIGGKIYQIPFAWHGKKLAVPSFSRQSFQQLPAEYVHGKEAVYIKKEALQPLISMMDEAALEGIVLQVETAYRDIETQKKIFLRKFRQGRSWDDVVRYVAPPGYSEHMLGLAVDFYPSGWRFAQTKGYSWLKKHAKEYGFVESYPRVPIPGHAKIAWESWHWFYTGCQKENARKLSSSAWQQEAVCNGRESSQ